MPFKPGATVRWRTQGVRTYGRAPFTLTEPLQAVAPMPLLLEAKTRRPLLQLHWIAASDPIQGSCAP